MIICDKCGKDNDDFYHMYGGTKALCDECQKAYLLALRTETDKIQVMKKTVFEEFVVKEE